MPEKESSIIDKVKFVIYIILGSIAIGSAFFGVEKYFAKEGEVKVTVSQLEQSDQSLSERLEISIIDDQIFQQEQTIQRIEDWKRFEQRTVEPELTPIEKDTLLKAKKRLEELENRKVNKIKKYEDGEH